MTDTLWTRDMTGCPSIWWKYNPPYNTIEQLKRMRDEYNAEHPDDVAYLTTYDEYMKERDAWYAEAESCKQQWQECSEEDYYEMLGCVPPLRHTRSFFFVGEPYMESEQGTLHSLYVRKGERFFHALRPITMGMDDILIEIEGIKVA